MRSIDHTLVSKSAPRWATLLGAMIALIKLG